MRKIYLYITSVLLFVACEDLDQAPPNFDQAATLTDYEKVLYAAYGYHLDAVSPMAIFGDFRSDNALFDESPYTDFHSFNGNDLATSMSESFFRPFYAALYRSIFSANTVINSSDIASQVGEAKFIRALSYFKLVQVFGDVTVRLDETEDPRDGSLLTRKSASLVYSEVIIPDLQNAITALDLSSSASANGRATSIAAQALLGKVYAQSGDYGNAATQLQAVIDDANVTSEIGLVSDFADIFGSANNLNSEILFATRISSSIGISSANEDLFTNWYAGKNTKADDNAPMSQDLIDAFAASTGDKRTVLTLNGNNSVKFNKDENADWPELRLTDVYMLLAEALNENTDSDLAREAALDLLDNIRTRAGLALLDHNVLNTQDLVRQAIFDERRLEFASEGHRWFDLQRFEAASPGALDAEMGETISSGYFVFPIPNSEVTSFDEIEQNAAYK